MVDTFITEGEPGHLDLLPWDLDIAYVAPISGDDRLTALSRFPPPCREGTTAVSPGWFCADCPIATLLSHDRSRSVVSPPPSRRD